MIFGIGTDIVEIARIKQAIERNPKLLTRLFTENELAYFEKRNMNIEHVAGGFTAKEAILKALGTGLSGLSWKEVEVLRGSSGKPMVKLYEKAKEHASKNNIGNIFLTISHSRDYATATAVAELSEENEVTVLADPFIQ